MTTLHKAAQAIRALREWIQAVPQDTPLPAMPGIDGDWLDDVEAALAQEPEQPTAKENPQFLPAALHEGAIWHTPGDFTVSISGLTIRQIQEIFEEKYHGSMMWSNGTAYPTDGVSIKFSSYAPKAIEPAQPAGQEPAKRLTDEHVTPADRWIEGELDRIDPHRHEQGHDGAEAEALRKLVFEFHTACDLLISHCNKHPTMGDSLFSVLLMRQLLGRGRDDVKGPT